MTLKRYEYVLDFAKKWFNILVKLFKTKEDLEEFKKVIAFHTFIGENVGDQYHQHIKIYKEGDIIFYGIVDHMKYDTEICLPLNKSFEIFKKFGFTMVPMDKSENFDNFDDLKTYLDDKYDEILLKTIKQSGEGNVVYFVGIGENGEEKVVSIAKLKTFEYRFYRKIREKIEVLLERYQKQKNLGFGDLQSNLKKESEELAENFKEELNFDKYIRFSEFVFNYITKYDNEKHYFDVFAEFIHILKYAFNKYEEKKDSEEKESLDDIYKKNKRSFR